MDVPTFYLDLVYTRPKVHFGTIWIDVVLLRFWLAQSDLLSFLVRPIFRRNRSAFQKNGRSILVWRHRTTEVMGKIPWNFKYSLRNMILDPAYRLVLNLHTSDLVPFPVAAWETRLGGTSLQVIMKSRFDWMYSKSKMNRSKSRFDTA